MSANEWVPGTGALSPAPRVDPTPDPSVPRHVPTELSPRSDFAFGIVALAARRSTCAETVGGAVALAGDRVLAVAWPNGIPCTGTHSYVTERRLVPDPTAMGGRAWADVPRCVAAVHAEFELVAQAARLGVSLQGCTVFCWSVPCLTCAQALAHAGVKEIHAGEDDGTQDATKLYLSCRGIKLFVGE